VRCNGPLGLNPRSEVVAVNSAETTYYVGHETIVVKDEASIHRIPQAIFSYLSRNEVHEEKHHGMPLDQVVEIGAQVHI
jgi:K+ transporter